MRIPMRTLAATLLTILLSTTLVCAQAPVSQPVHRLYVFGDSYSDMGEGYLDSDGPTAVAYFAKRLGFKLYPSNTAKVAGKSLDYAVSGARSGSGEGQREGDALFSYGMKNQVADFLAQVDSHAITFDPATTLFYIAGGLNDSRLPEGSTAANEEDEIRSLYKAGARRFEVALLTEAIPGFGAVGQRINPSLKTIPAALAAELPDADIRLSQWGAFYDEVLTHPAQYGLTNTTEPCAGRALRNEAPTPCATPETYFFYHAGHPSTAAHKAVGDKLYEELNAPK